MGKWTLEHHDEVLRDKMKVLVRGAVQRMRLESNVEKCQDPIISFEAFVEELDTGDSFAASIVDILVKEYADRRMRSTPEDRHLISDRTAKALRNQAAPLRIYRERHTATSRFTGRRYHTMDYPPAVGDTLSEDDDEILTTFNGGMEGARLPSELFDAYNPAGDFYAISHPEATPLATGSPEPADPVRDLFEVTSPRPPSPSSLGPYRSSAWVPLNANASSSALNRPSSLRRPTRTRTVDFNDFTHRRRSNFRSLQNTAEPSRPEQQETSTASGWRYRPRDETPAGYDEPAASSSSSSSQQQPRRFFPLNAWQTRRREVGGAFPWSHEAQEAPAAPRPTEQPSSSSTSTQSSSQLWYSLTASAADAPALPPAMERENSTHLSLERRLTLPPIPTLRRGGIRPPESLLSRHASPTDATSLETGPAHYSLVASGERARASSTLDITDWPRAAELHSPRSLSPSRDS